MPSRYVYTKRFFFSLSVSGLSIVYHTPQPPHVCLFSLAHIYLCGVPQPTAPAISTLRKGDVVMKVDGISVANDGSIPFRSGERVSMRYYMSQLFPGDEVRSASPERREAKRSESTMLNNPLRLLLDA